jgi:hypothetical protein
MSRMFNILWQYFQIFKEKGDRCPSAPHILDSLGLLFNYVPGVNDAELSTLVGVEDCPEAEVSEPMPPVVTLLFVGLELLILLKPPGEPLNKDPLALANGFFALAVSLVMFFVTFVMFFVALVIFIDFVELVVAFCAKAITNEIANKIAISIINPAGIRLFIYIPY